jgi:hypothetical protein
MAWDGNDAIVLINPQCTHYSGAEVTITVPGPGTIIVNAVVMIDGNHIQGWRDNGWINVANSTTDCTDNPYISLIVVPSSAPTDQYWESVPVLRPVNVSAAGTHTFYVNGVMINGVGPGGDY